MTVQITQVTINTSNNEWISPARKKFHVYFGGMRKCCPLQMCILMSFTIWTYIVGHSLIFEHWSFRSNADHRSSLTPEELHSQLPWAYFIPRNAPKISKPIEESVFDELQKPPVPVRGYKHIKYSRLFYSCYLIYLSLRNSLSTLHYTWVERSTKCQLS
jgi:hypothetical protein